MPGRDDHEDRREGFGVPVTVKLGPDSSQAEITATKDGETVDILKLLPVMSIELDASVGKSTKLTLEVESVEAFADQIRATLSQEDLRWLAKLHGCALVPIGEVKPAGVRCGECGAAYSLGVSVDGQGWVELMEAPER